MPCFHRQLCGSCGGLGFQGRWELETTFRHSAKGSCSYPEALMQFPFGYDLFAAYGLNILSKKELRSSHWVYLGVEVMPRSLLLG